MKDTTFAEEPQDVQWDDSPPHDQEAMGKRCAHHARTDSANGCLTGR
jgi:hypothetical protein